MNIGWFMIIYFFFVYFLWGYRDGNDYSRIPWKVIYGMMVSVFIIGFIYIYFKWNEFTSSIHTVNDIFLSIIFILIGIFLYILTYGVGYWIGKKIYYHHLGINKGSKIL